MFKLEPEIKKWRRAMLASGIEPGEVLEELESHLRDEVEQQRRAGLALPQAFEAAVRHLGEGRVLQREFANAAEPQTPIAIAKHFTMLVLLSGSRIASLFFFTVILGLALVSLMLAPDLARWLTLALIVVIPVVGLMLTQKLRWRLWWRVGGAMLALAFVFAYLASDDDTFRLPVTLDQVAPIFPDADESYAVLMRYSRDQPSEDAKAFAQWKPRVLGSAPIASVNEPIRWVNFLRQNRAAIEADWADLAPQRRWLAELNAFDRIGDLDKLQAGANLILPSISANFWRSLCLHTVAMAGLQALDGQGDEAYATLLPLLQLSRKLEPSSRTLTRAMVARTIQGTTISWAMFVLDHATVSPDLKAKFAASLAEGSGGVAGVRRLYAVERAASLDVFRDSGIDALLMGVSQRRDYGWYTWSRSLAVLAPVLYNPHRTYNLYADYMSDLEDLAAQRELDKMGRRTQMFFSEEYSRFKNLLGGVLLSYSIPAYVKITESYWRVEDERNALRQRLASPDQVRETAPAAFPSDHYVAR